MYAVKAGQSSFLGCTEAEGLCTTEDQFELFEFTHDLVYQNEAFAYDAAKSCMVTSSTCNDLSSCRQAPYGGPCCATRYSPYGQWQVTLYDQQGVDFSQLATIRFWFKVTSKEVPSAQDNWFGKPGNLYQQDRGSDPHCTPGQGQDNADDKTVTLFK